MKAPKYTRHHRAQPVTGRSWLDLRPYERNTDYDYGYIKIANEVHAVLAEKRDLIDPAVGGPQSLVHLSIVLTSYLEDILNEIGPWKAFIERNHALHGYYMPHIMDEEYQPGDFNYSDLRYIIWHFFNQTKKTFFAPESPVFDLLAEAVGNLLQDQWETAPISDFFEEWLTLDDEIDFFALRERLRWLTTHNYLLFFEFGIELREDTKAFVESRETGMDPMLMLHTFAEEYYYTRPSSYAAMTGVDWLLELVTASETVKAKIRETQHHFTAHLRYERETETDLYFSHPGWEADLRVTRDSIKGKTDFHPGDVCVMHLVSYGGVFWLSGSLIGTNPRALDDPGNYLSQPFWRYPESVRQTMIETTAEMEQRFRAFFGNFFYIGKDRQDLIERVRAYYEAELSQTDRELSPTERQQQHTMQERLLGQIPQDNQTAIVFVSGTGVMFHPGAGIVWELLDREAELSLEERKSLFFFLIAELQADLLEYILENLPPRKILFPVPQAKLDFWPQLRFYSRYLHPDDYLPRVPYMVPN